MLLHATNLFGIDLWESKISKIMKKSIYVVSWIFFLYNNPLMGQQLVIGDQLDSTVTLFDVENSQVYELKRYAGKMILLDFWATWCAPCVANIPHLEALQDKFKEKLVVIPVSLEDENRINKFTSKTPYNLKFSLDTENELKSLFPFRIIPHAVLIDSFGKILAITDPKLITAEVISSYLNGEKIQLPTKKDRVEFDLMEDDLFELPSNVTQSFKVLGEFDGLPSFQKGASVGEYHHRRVSFINQSIRGMYQYVYDIGWRRFQIMDKDTRMLEDDIYSVDLVIENPDEQELKAILMMNLKKQFGLEIDTVHVESEIVLLYIEDENRLPEKSNQSSLYQASGDYFKSKGASLADFAGYLEQFGIIGAIVVSEFREDAFFEIDFQFEPENPDSFWESLKNIGLNLKKERREVDFIKISVLD
jgi:thiol-disulfide isomerase/thioredoxin